MTRISLRVAEVERLADRLERGANRAAIAISAARAVNETTVEFNEASIAGQTRDINLTPAYVKSKTDVALATPTGRARAEILTRGDLTPLGNFTPLAMIPGFGAIRRAGPRKGLRNAGTTLAVRRSSPILEKQWFVLPLRRGRVAGGNGFGVFVRSTSLRPSARAETREGRFGKRHIYGPSPYALAARYIDQNVGQLRERLVDRALRLVGDEVFNGLTK